MSQTAFTQVIEKIDEANSQDPHLITVEGEPYPYELHRSAWLTEWVKRLTSKPSEELLIAARAQHIRRWEIPRTTYPKGQTGYLSWRERLKRFHADIVGTFMTAANYPQPSIQKVKNLLIQKNRASDPEGQMLEDAICLAFLENELEDFLKKTDATEEKIIDILQKTWGKMSTTAQQLAKQLALPPETARLVTKALAPS